MANVRTFVGPVLCLLLDCSHAAPRGAAPVRIEEATIDELQGAMSAGELTSHALVQHTVSSLGGQTLNPYDLARTPGGSSGGTAVAVAANMASVSLGSDTVNSILRKRNAQPAAARHGAQTCSDQQRA